MAIINPVLFDQRDNSVYKNMQVSNAQKLDTAITNTLEKRLWEAVDQLRANSALTAQEYSRPVLGLIFFDYTDHKFSIIEKIIAERLHSRAL